MADENEPSRRLPAHELLPGNEIILTRHDGGELAAEVYRVTEEEFGITRVWLKGTATKSVPVAREFQIEVTERVAVKSGLRLEQRAVTRQPDFTLHRAIQEAIQEARHVTGEMPLALEEDLHAAVAQFISRAAEWQGVLKPHEVELLLQAPVLDYDKDDD